MYARALLAAVGTATLYAVALPPFDVPLAGWFALAPLLLATRPLSGPRAAWVGALTGFVFSWAVAWWLPIAAAQYFAMGMLPAIGAAALVFVVVCSTTFGAFAAAAATMWRSVAAPIAVPAIAAAWVAVELFRARMLVDPWGLLGYTQHSVPDVIQMASWTGVYGVSFVLALTSASLVESLYRLHRRRWWTAASILAWPVVLVGWTLAVAACSSEGRHLGGFGARQVALVQTGLAPSFHWTREHTDRQIALHTRATEGITSHEVGLIVWPEHAIGRYLATDPGLAALLGGLAARKNADLLLGIPRWDDGRVFNSAQLITRVGRNGGHYDKQLPLPFAETSVGTAPTSTTPDDTPREFARGRRTAPLKSFVRLGVVVCHEILHPDLVNRAVSDGAEVLINLANDGWLDATRGIASRQHFAMAVFRAVETNRYLVRAATTGVSGIIDPYGRVTDTLASGESGVITASIPGRRGTTLYVRIGDAFAFGCLAFAFGVLLLPRALFVRSRAPWGVGRSEAGRGGWRTPVTDG
jgi:apolipoprotein N-acyltransferase